MDISEKFCETLNNLSLGVSSAIGRGNFDYYNKFLLSNFIISNKINFLINCEKYTGKPNVDACESAKYECLHGNSVLPGIIQDVCEDLNPPWGHVSSGCIYSGRTT